MLRSGRSGGVRFTGRRKGKGEGLPPLGPLPVDFGLLRAEFSRKLPLDRSAGQGDAVSLEGDLGDGNASRALVRAVHCSGPFPLFLLDMEDEAEFLSSELEIPAPGAFKAFLCGQRGWCKEKKPGKEKEEKGFETEGVHHVLNPGFLIRILPSKDIKFFVG